jgi:uncharacterized protein YjbI with pentapeptide repeats
VARKVFIGLLAACVYCWLVIGTTTDVALILNTATTPLPIINTPIPIAGFYVVGAALLAAVYCYLHFYLLRLWRTLATLPAVFPDGVALDERTDPWLLTNLVRTEFPHLRATAPPLARLENLLTIALAWWLVPLTLIALWTRYLPAHYSLGTMWLVLLIGATALFGRHSFRLAKATLRREPDRGSQADGERGVLGRGIHELGRLRPDKLTVWLTLALAVVSFSAFVDSPRSPDYWTIPRALDLVGIRTYANLREAAVAERPEDWDDQDWSRVTRVDLSNRNLAFADATRAFLANADLRGVNLTGAMLERADLRGAVLYDADYRIARLERANLLRTQLQDADLREAQLQGADLRDAQLQGAVLWEAQLQGANLRFAQLQGANLFRARLQGASLFRARLQGANLREAQLQGADLERAQLQGADLERAQLQHAYLFRAQLQGANLRHSGLQGANFILSRVPFVFFGRIPLPAQLQGADLRNAQLQGAELRSAQLQGAELRSAQLQGAELRSAQLQGANLRGAQLQGADLTGAQLQGADLRGAALWRALVPYAVWDLADLRGAHVRPLDDAEIAALITGDRPSQPAFPEAWKSEPNVMFEQGDPEPERLEWGPLRWERPEEYDKDLAGFLGELACGRDVPEAQTRGLAIRPLFDVRIPERLGGEPDRLWHRLFAERVTGPDCPPAKGLPENMRRDLEALAAELKEEPAAAAIPEAASPDPQ